MWYKAREEPGLLASVDNRKLGRAIDGLLMTGHRELNETFDGDVVRKKFSADVFGLLFVVQKRV